MLFPQLVKVNIQVYAHTLRLDVIKRFSLCCRRSCDRGGAVFAAGGGGGGDPPQLLGVRLAARRADLAEGGAGGEGGDRAGWAGAHLQFRSQIQSHPARNQTQPRPYTYTVHKPTLTVCTTFWAVSCQTGYYIYLMSAGCWAECDGRYSGE